MREAIKNLISQNALFVCNHSGGKDSQAMFIYLRKNIPSKQLVIIHANLPGADWAGISEHILKYSYGYPYLNCSSHKTFMSMVRHRGMFPSPKNRQCTSDLKRGPLSKGIRFLCNSMGFNKIVNCTGIRAEESSNRARREVFTTNEKESNSKRDWYEWLPIHKWTVDMVFGTISDYGEEPFWTYKAGMTRLSCVFCIMASRADLKTAAKLNPELYNEYCKLEREIDHTLLMPGKNGERFFLDKIAGEENAVK